MFKCLKLTNVGPAPEMELQFGNRLNLLTGDNGLGKSFLLDIAWWALTRRWPAEVNKKLTSGLMARPSDNSRSSIEFCFDSRTKPINYVSTFDRNVQAWTGKAGRPANPGLVLYAQADGSFAVWDPARNYWNKIGGIDVQDRRPAYVFSPREIWDGLRDEEKSTSLCNGLIYDWVIWQKENGAALGSLKKVLKALSSSSREIIEPGELMRISLDDSRDIPTIKMPYGQDVPILHASAGMRRILALAYLLVWSWEEHKQASKLLGLEYTNQVIFLIDEIEAHLHPKWQRSIVRTLLGVMDELTEAAQVQVVAATHSPLVLASVEPLFDPQIDAWFDLDMVVGKEGSPVVELNKRPFVRRGDVSTWLTSDAFNLSSARSLEAEQVLEEAAVALSKDNLENDEVAVLEGKLHRVLGDTDPFWMRWGFVAEQKGWRR